MIEKGKVEWKYNGAIKRATPKAFVSVAKHGTMNWWKARLDFVHGVITDEMLQDILGAVETKHFVKWMEDQEKSRKEYGVWPHDLRAFIYTKLRTAKHEED